MFYYLFMVFPLAWFHSEAKKLWLLEKPQQPQLLQTSQNSMIGLSASFQPGWLVHCHECPHRIARSITSWQKGGSNQTGTQLTKSLGCMPGCTQTRIGMQSDQALQAIWQWCLPARSALSQNFSLKNTCSTLRTSHCQGHLVAEHIKDAVRAQHYEQILRTKHCKLMTLLAPLIRLAELQFTTVQIILI